MTCRQCEVAVRHAVRIPTRRRRASSVWPASTARRGACGCAATGAPRTEASREASYSRRSPAATTSTTRPPRWSSLPPEARSHSTDRRASRATARTSPTRRLRSDPRMTTFSTPPRRGPRRPRRRPARSSPRLPATLTVGADARQLDVTATSLASNAPRSQRIVGAYANLHLSRELGVVGVATTFADRVDRDDLIAATVSSPRASVELSRGAASLSASIGNGYSPPSLADQFFHEGVLVKANPGARAGTHPR